MDLKVARIDSVITQMPFPYYHLPFCELAEREHDTQHLGASLRGDRIEASPYRLEFEKDHSCKILCRKSYDKQQLKLFEEKIREGYRAYWLVDNLPAATRVQGIHDDNDMPDDSYSYERGFEIGTTEKPDGKGAAYLNNHVRLTIKYHKHPDKPGARIVAFEVEPFSVKHTYKRWPGGDVQVAVDNGHLLDTCKPLKPVSHRMVPMQVDGGQNQLEIVFTYDVVWSESDTRWASRWDMYLLVSDDQVHWFSVFNSLVTVTFLSGMVAIILLRTLNADITTYNEIDFEEEGREDTGWKLLHGDVFRPPEHVNLLSALVGTGCQFFCAALAMLVFACFGFVSPAHRGGLMTAMLLTFVLMGTFSGYFSARNYKMLGGSDWRTNTLWAAMLVPTIIFGIFFVLNFVLWSEGSSGAVPFGALCKMLFMWFGVHVPLAFTGGYFGQKRAKIENPCRPNHIARAVPEKEWYLQPIFVTLFGGSLSFGAIFIELYFVLSSIWLRHYYYVFGFLLLVFVILAITCSEMSIVLCYIHLCHGDYDWWWRAFLTSGSCAIHVFLYSIFYYMTQLNISKTLSMFLYFGYNIIFAFVIFVLTGTIGYQSTLWFVRKIYSEIKTD